MVKSRLIGLLSHTKKYIVYQVLMQWIALWCQILIVFNIAELMEAALYSKLDRQLAMKCFFFIAIGVVLRVISDKAASYASYKASVDVKRVLRTKIYEKLLKLGSSYREKISTSEVVQISVEGVEQLENYFGRYLPQLFYALLAPLTLFAVLSFVDLKASFVLLLCVPLIPISIVAVQKLAKKLLSNYWKTYTELGDSFLENLQGLTTLKIYQADEKKAKRMDEESELFRKITMRVLIMQLNSISVMDIIAYGGAAIGMIIAVIQLYHGNISVSGATVIVLLASEFFIPMRILGSFFHIAMNGMAASDKIFALLDIEESSERQRTPGESSLITIQNMSFSYEKNKNSPGYKPVLDNVNMSIPTGSFISLVGVSGSGKSTIADLIMGRNKGYEGAVTIGGVELSAVSEGSLMKKITKISHDSYLFKGTVRDNLLMGNRNADDDAMREALENVNLMSFLEAQQGLDTLVEENGKNISGGQRQRLSIARALLHDTPIYIFDEATSNIDVESEEMIMQVIHRLAEQGKTVVLISHRLANVVALDCIYMLKNGKVDESGTHEELMKRGGSYSSLFEHQRHLEEYRKAGR